jgi:hypothetical protein
MPVLEKVPMYIQVSPSPSRAHKRAAIHRFVDQFPIRFVFQQAACRFRASTVGDRGAGGFVVADPGRDSERSGIR